MSRPKSLCRECGAEVLWRKWAEGGNAPPLLGIGDAMTLDEHDKVVKVPVYVRHQCDPKQAAAWRERVLADERDLALRHLAETERREARREQRDAQADMVTTMREEAYRRAAKVDCPKCPALEAEECLNLNTLAGRGKSTKTHTSWPHPERVLEAERQGY